jgi:mannose-6-phosphate isomerase-like protein (cupin superfamily)
LIAAGPILNADAALKAVSAGARLIVTPELNLGAADIEHIHKKGARVIMPASSVQEAQEAKERRADAITVFSSWPKQGGPCKALEISEAVGNTPVIVTGNKVIDLIHKDQRWGAEVAIQDGQDERSVKELLWFFSVSPDALSEAENIGDLLEKMASDEVALSELDGLVITLINKKPEAYKELLMAGSPREVASWLIGYLAVPEIAKPAASAGHLEGFLTEALLNSDINKIAAAVAHMNVAIMTGAFTGFELPTQIAAKPVQKERDLRLESLINQQGNLEFPSYCWRTAILEQHPNTREHLMVLKGKVVVLSCPSPGKDLTAVALGKGDIITVPPGQYHIAVSMTAGAQVRSCYDDPVIEWRPVLPKTEFRCIGAVFDVRNYHPETPILPDPVLSAV